MAKQNKPQTKPNPPVKEIVAEDEINVNLQPYLTPISIIVSGILVAVAILLTGRGGATANVAGASNTATVIPSAAEDPNPAETTSIADSPYLGNKDTAKVAIVEYSDFECPYCKRNFTDVFPSIKTNYIDTGKVIYVYRNYIAVPAHDPAATQEAYASLCVRELSGNSNAKFFQYHDLLYTNTGSNGTGLQNNTTVFTLAASIGVDQNQLKTCIDSAKYKDTITADEAAAGSAGVQGTPGFIVGTLNSDGSVNGKLIAGAYPFATFQTIIDSYLQGN